MPQVASEATTPAFKPILPNSAPAAQNSDGAQDSPFASLLDATQAGSAQPPPLQAAVNDVAAPAVWLELVQSPAPDSTTVPSGGKAAQSSDNTTFAAVAAMATIVAVAGTDKAVGADKASVDAKIGGQTAASDDAKPAGDGQSTDGLIPADPAAIPTNGPTQTMMTVAAVAPAPILLAGTIAPPVAVTTSQPTSAPVQQAASDRDTRAAPVELPQMPPDGVPQAAPAAVPQIAADGVRQIVPPTVPQAAPDGVRQAAPAAVPQAALDDVPQAVPLAVPQAASDGVLQAMPAAEHPASVAAAVLTAKPAKLTVPQADVGNPTDNSNSSAKTSLAPQSDGKLLPAAGNANQQGAPRPNDEVTADSRHTSTAETPPAIATHVQAAPPQAPVDGLQQASLTPLLQDASAMPAPINPAALLAPAAPVAAGIPLAGVAVEIAGQALAGKNRFEIRLDPPELGRIEVRLDVGRDGSVTTQIAADRSDTLNLLQRDSADLERALQDAGLKTSDNGLQFSLRDQSMGRDQGYAPTPGAAQLVVSDDALAAVDVTPRNYGRYAGLGGGIDIRV